MTPHREVPKAVRKSIKKQTALIDAELPLALKETYAVIHDLCKRMEDVERECSDMRAKEVRSSGRVFELETLVSHLFHEKAIPEEALNAPSSKVLPRSKVCPEIPRGNLGGVLPDRPSAASAFISEDPDTPLRLMVRQLRQQAIFEEQREREEFRTSRMRRIPRTLETYVPWMRVKGSHPGGCFNP